MGNTADDTRLLEALQLDLAGHFYLLMEAYHQRLHGYALSQVKSDTDADDIMQECWMDIYKALNRFSKEKILSLQLRSWLFTIVRHEVATYFGKKKFFTSIESMMQEGIEPEDHIEVSPEVLLELRERLKEAQVSIEQLAPGYRTVLTLHFFEGLSYQEIAQRLDKSVETVRIAVSRGAKLLRERLTVTVS